MRGTGGKGTSQDFVKFSRTQTSTSRGNFFTPEELSNDGTIENGQEVIRGGIVEAHHFAVADPFRATTHNKGVMNAISSVAVACGRGLASD